MKIDINQSVSIDPHGFVQYFHHASTDTFHVLALPFHQFLTLNDVMNIMKHFSSLKSFPLSEGVWLHKKKNSIEIRDTNRQIFFRFNHNGLEEYKNHVHHQVRSFLQDGMCTSRHKYDARDECESKNSSRRPVSIIRRGKQILSGSSRNGSDENDKHTTKCTSFSRRKSSNTRRSLRRRSGKYAARIREQIEENKEDGEISSVTSSNQEYGCEPEIEISCESAEDCV